MLGFASPGGTTSVWTAGRLHLVGLGQHPGKRRYRRDGAHGLQCRSGAALGGRLIAGTTGRHASQKPGGVAAAAACVRV